MIHIDGVPHPIRFGAPSRELYVGDHPFRGAFNGPPMIANINGRRHEFRLCGPPPEVRIDQDPCYELSRHMNLVRVPQATTAAPQGLFFSSLNSNCVEVLILDSTKNQDVFALLKKAREKGILPPSLTNSGQKSSNDRNMSSTIKKTGVVEIARDVSAPPALADFKIGALTVRYSNVVNALHQPRLACNHCGIGFSDTSSAAYQYHVDGHIQEFLNKMDTRKSRQRPWFMSADVSAFVSRCDF